MSYSRNRNIKRPQNVEENNHRGSGSLNQRVTQNLKTTTTTTKKVVSTNKVASQIRDPNQSFNSIKYPGQEAYDFGDDAYNEEDYDEYYDYDDQLSQDQEYEAFEPRQNYPTHTTPSNGSRVNYITVVQQRGRKATNRPALSFVPSSAHRAHQYQTTHTISQRGGRGSVPERGGLVNIGENTTRISAVGGREGGVRPTPRNFGRGGAYSGMVSSVRPVGRSQMVYGGGVGVVRGMGSMLPIGGMVGGYGVGGGLLGPVPQVFAGPGRGVGARMGPSIGVPGRGVTGRGVANVGVNGVIGPNRIEKKPTKETLDAELDDYMKHSKNYVKDQLDDDLDSYMKKRSSTSS